MLSKLKYYLKRIYQISTHQEIKVLPGHLAYFFVLSIVPTITLLGYIASLFGISINTIVEFITNSFSKETANYFVPIISGKPLDFKLFTLIMTGYFIASNGAHSIILSSNRVYGIKDSDFIRRRIKAIFMTFFIVALFLFIIIVPIFGNSILNLMDQINPNTNIVEQIKLIVPFIKWPVTWFTIFLFIKIIYTMAPDKKVSSLTVNRGTFFTTTMWSIVTFIYTYYAHNLANYDIFYGSLTSIVVMMIWLYFLSYIFVIGLVLNKGSEERHIKRQENIDKIEKK